MSQETHDGLSGTDVKLVRMANQIATFFHSQPEEERISGIADHISKFWDPHMRLAFLHLVESNTEGLDPLVIEAARLVRRPQAA